VDLYGQPTTTVDPRDNLVLYGALTKRYKRMPHRSEYSTKHNVSSLN